jgi:hypothetical protein
MYKIDGETETPMSLEKTQDDSPQKESWPNDLLEKFGSLSLPSLYDFILSQEKLAAEIRKQNKEIHSMNEQFKQVKEKIIEIDEHIAHWIERSHDQEKCWQEEELEEQIPEPSVVSEEDEIIMETLDSLWNLLQANQETVETILALVPKELGFWRLRKPVWRLRLEEILAGYSQGIEALQQKIALSLADRGITVIFPEAGFAFDHRFHKVVETVAGKRRGTIIKTTRCGYLRGEKVLRYAEVSIMR